MKETFYRLGMTAVLACTSLAGSVHALESSAAGSNVAQGNMAIISSRIDVTSSTLDTIVRCNASRKFYAPSDPKKDANGCVGVGDYPLTMGPTSNINFSGGLISSNAAKSGDYLARFNNTATAGYGVYGQSVNGNGVYTYAPNGQSVYGASDFNWAGYFSSTNGYGVYTRGPNYPLYANNTGSTQWTAIINAGASPYGLNITNNAGNANLCLNGTCITTLSAPTPGGLKFGGTYELYNGSGCAVGNQYLPPTQLCGGMGGFCFSIPTCACPSGYGGVAAHSANNRDGNWYSLYYCFAGSP